MIQETLQQAAVELSEQHHLVVSSDEVEGIETVTVYTQGGEASEFIVYVQEAMQPVEEQTVEQTAQELWRNVQWRLAAWFAKAKSSGVFFLAKSKLTNLQLICEARPCS